MLNPVNSLRRLGTFHNKGVCIIFGVAQGVKMFTVAMLDLFFLYIPV